MKLGKIWNSCYTGERRDLTGVPRKAAFVLLLGIFSIYLYGVLLPVTPPMFFHRPAILLSIIAVAFLFYSPTRKARKETAVPIVDYLLAGSCFAVMAYYLVNAQLIEIGRVPLIDPLGILELIVGLVMLLLVLEGVRRALGMLLVLFIVPLLFYMYLGAYIPGYWSHMGLSFTEIIDLVSFHPDGIFGMPIWVLTSMVIGFFVFGQLLMGSGLGKTMMTLSMGLMGRYAGGPGKVAVVSSAMMGMASGSGMANVATTGSVTIPMMKRIGFKPEVAGAIEATASTGGGFMPPIMGMGPLIMSQLTGIPYIKILLAAFIPAVLYFSGVIFQTHLEAKKAGLKGAPPEELPSAGKAFAQGWYLFLPLVLLIWLLLEDYSPGKAVVYSMPLIIVLSWLRKDTRMGIKQILDCVHRGMMLLVMMGPAMAIGGILLATTGFSGLAGKLASLITTVSAESLFIALVIAMVTNLILGMPLPGIVCYLITVLLIVPATVKIGVPLMASHLFAIYFSHLAGLTPPTGGAFYIAAGIAGAPPLRTGWIAVKLAIAGFMVPYFFVYRPEVLLIGTPLGIIVGSIITLCGVLAIGAAVEGWLLARLNALERILLGLGAALLLFVSWQTTWIGFVVIAAVFAWQWHKWRKSRLNETVGATDEL